MPVDPAAIRGRFETDLEDPPLEGLIEDAYQAVRDRYGPDRSTADPPVPLTVTMPGNRRTIDLVRPADTVDEVVELTPSGFVSGGGETVLSANDYEVANGGRTVRRLNIGDHPPTLTSPSSEPRWGYSVRVTYIPVDDQARRDEVVIKLVGLGIEYDPTAKRTVGDVSRENPDYGAEREKILGTLAPRGSLLLA